MRAACLSLSAPSPARRPVRLALSALSPPSLSSATHLFTARRLALNKFAAATCLIPSRTAFTTCRRSMCCAAGLSFLASSRLFMQTLTYHALFGARISKYLTSQAVLEQGGRKIGTRQCKNTRSSFCLPVRAWRKRIEADLYVDGL